MGDEAPDDLITTANSSAFFCCTISTRLLAMNDVLRTVVLRFTHEMAEYGMKQPPLQVVGQWVYDNMTHSQVERLTVDSSFPQTVAMGTVMHERQECIPRSVKGAMAIVKAVKYKLKQLALEEYGVAKKIELHEEPLREFLRNFRVATGNPNITLKDSVTRYAKIFGKLSDPDVASGSRWSLCGPATRPPAADGRAPRTSRCAPGS